ncbi:GlxA family transcriptional regulator [Vibrio genomosp. F6]|uniref:GlxA family transcriptional regulator n=1 Tax=Vibrio genomosp. F6 TaxID=723172 RepID=UPI0019D03FD3|nr:helix-turn-helix domain-containing protein [Vibrio genomosp. F6]
MMAIQIAIIDYPESLKTATYGFIEMFQLANRIIIDQHLSYHFESTIIQVPAPDINPALNLQFDIILLPPSNQSSYYLQPDLNLIGWLSNQHKNGAIISAACAGVFILAETQLLKKRSVTTHWALSQLFKQHHPDIPLDSDKILINHRDVITAGGMMSWLDLGFEIVSQYSHPHVMRQLGKMMVVDTGQREQRYYQQFSPIFNHGDSDILSIQKMLQTDFSQRFTIRNLANQCCLTERTFLRRFIKATQLKPTQYIQRLRIQHACHLLETSTQSFDWVAHSVGYEDVSACRKVFINIMGLTPSEFRQRFHINHSVNASFK